MLDIKNILFITVLSDNKQSAKHIHVPEIF